MYFYFTKSFPIQFELKDKIDEWVARMGYHFVVREIETDDEVNRGDRLSIALVVENVGVAPIYHGLPLYVRLKGDACEKTFDTGVDIRRWIEGKFEEKVSLESTSSGEENAPFISLYTTPFTLRSDFSSSIS